MGRPFAIGWLPCTVVWCPCRRLLLISRLPVYSGKTIRQRAYARRAKLEAAKLEAAAAETPAG
jgi:hypothetical protein